MGGGWLRGGQQGVQGDIGHLAQRLPRRDQGDQAQAGGGVQGQIDMGGAQNGVQARGAGGGKQAFEGRVQPGRALRGIQHAAGQVEDEILSGAADHMIGGGDGNFDVHARGIAGGSVKQQGDAVGAEFQHPLAQPPRGKLAQGMGVGGVDDMVGHARGHPAFALDRHRRVGAGQHAQGQVDGIRVPIRHDHRDVTVAPDQVGGAGFQILTQRDQFGRVPVFADAVGVVVVKVMDRARGHVLAALAGQGQAVIDVVIVPAIAGDMFVETAHAVQRRTGDEEKAVDMGLIRRSRAPVAGDEGAGQQGIAAKEISRQHDVGVGFQDLVAGGGAEAGVEGIRQHPAPLALDPQDADAGVSDPGVAQSGIDRGGRGPVDNHHFGDFGIGQPGRQGAQQVLVAVHRTGDQADAGAAFGFERAKVAQLALEGRGDRGQGLRAAAPLGQDRVKFVLARGVEMQGDQFGIARENRAKRGMAVRVDHVAHRQQFVQRCRVVPGGRGGGHAQIKRQQSGVQQDGAVVTRHRRTFPKRAVLDPGRGCRTFSDPFVPGQGQPGQLVTACRFGGRGVGWPRRCAAWRLVGVLHPQDSMVHEPLSPTPAEYLCQDEAKF